MAFLRALPALLLAGCLLGLSACSTPPPPRVTTRPVQKLNTALLLASLDGKLTPEQIAAKRDAAIRYLTERGLLAPEDVLVPDTATADRIIRVLIAADGGFNVTIFNPGGRFPLYAAAPAYRSDVRVRVGADDYWPIYDPWFDQGYYYSPFPAAGYYPYQPRNHPRPHYPRDYVPPGEPRRPAPPPTVSDPTPQPRPRLPGRGGHSGRPFDPDQPRDHRPDWRDRHPPSRPDNHDRSGNDHDHSPRPTPPPPAMTPPPSVPEPRQTPPPEPRAAPERTRDHDNRDGPQPAK